MTLSGKSFSLWLFLSLLAGGALGAWLAMQWKDREIAQKIDQAVAAEREKVAPLQAERDALEARLAQTQMVVELGSIAIEVENQNFGNARERLEHLFDDLHTIHEGATAAARTALADLLARREPIVSALESLSPETESLLRELQLDLQKALSPS